jgi:BON domain
MFTLRQIQAVGLAGTILFAGAGVARAQTTGTGGGSGGTGGSSTGGSSTGGYSSMGGPTTGGSSSAIGGSTGVISNQVTGGSSFLTGQGQMVTSAPAQTNRGSGFFTTYSGSNNMFATYYLNPLAQALGTSNSTVGASAGLRNSSGGGTGGFGGPLYANTSNNNNSTMPGVTGSIRSPGMSGGSTGRVPAYSLTLDFEAPRLPPPSQMQVNLQGMLARSSSLAGASIRVAINGPTVVLRGTVSNDRERRLAENMIRLTPGVRDVRNELNIR